MILLKCEKHVTDHREFNLEDGPVGMPHKWRLSDTSIITVLELLGKELKWGLRIMEKEMYWLPSLRTVTTLIRPQALRNFRLSIWFNLG